MKIIQFVLVVLAVLNARTSIVCAEPFQDSFQPLLKEFCITCHSTEKQKGDLDLERFSSVAEIKKHPAIWEAVLYQIGDGEMPPKKSPQFSAEQKLLFTQWVQETLDQVALENAGDPGPVILRRLSNREYTYTLRDLTAVETLDPAREFPTDGAAGEGFTNVGSALVMSPVLLTKYLDAAKEVANHAVLLPDGIRFSKNTSSRDLTDETLAEIRQLYARFSSAGGASAMNLQGVTFDTNAGGRLSVDEFVSALNDHRDALTSGKISVAELAANQKLNEKYLGLLWEMLNDEDPSLLLASIQRKYRDGNLKSADIQQWQQSLWRFTSVGHIGKVNGPNAWQEPVNPIATEQEIRLKLVPSADQSDLTIYLSAGDAGDGNEHDFVVWMQPKLLLEGHPPVPLPSLNGLVKRMDELLKLETDRTAMYLNAIADAEQSETPIEELGKRNGLDAGVLENWVAIVQLGKGSKPVVTGHYTNKLSNVGGYADIRGWGVDGTPNFFANKSEDTYSFATLTIPGRSVNMHPSPDKDALAYWQSPLDGAIKVHGMLADSDGVCGNGVAWRVELIGHAGSDTIVDGVFDNGKRSEFAPDRELTVRKGDLIKLVVNARDQSHSCDTTQFQLIVTEQAGEKRVWDFAKDVIDRVHESNPLSDSYGNAAVWHFCDSTESAPAKNLIPSGSSLAKWRDAVREKKPKAELADLALSVQQAVTGNASDLSEADKVLRETLLDARGPMKWLANSAGAMDSANIETQAPSVLEFNIPAALVSNAEVLVTGKLHPEKGKEGSVQLQLLTVKPESLTGVTASKAESAVVNGKWSDNNLRTIHSAPVIVNKDSDAQRRFETSFDDFRRLFPAALCYMKIVPVDEVVTLTLFYREDEFLKRLMLSETQSARLDRLWEELQFVSDAPLKQVDAFEQLYQFATQDAEPSAFEPLREPLKQQAADYRKRLIEVEPVHVQAVIDFATKAWRRPLSSEEQDQLRSLYATLRAQDLAHAAAVRQLLARVLIAPAFLYRGEHAGEGSDALPVNDWELATRLSYFLWSSCPDEDLREVAAAGKLHEPNVLVSQTERMLRDAKVRRLATEFGAQYLHVRDLETMDEKSERHFPSFVSLRESMQEETVRFFIDMFQEDRSLLSLLDADHTFVDGPLATLYGIKIESEEWQRVDGIRALGRGGILGFSSTLSKQSGASRTSPILRGNWISEVLLGEKLPRPPKDVPVLPDEAPEGLTERELIERHSSDPACARCHERIDPFGFALESFDAIGRFRSQDASGLEIDSRAVLADGTQFEGIEGLRAYLLETRRDDFLRQFCRKLLGYAIGRSVQLSDRPLIDEMLVKLKANEYHVSSAIELIVRIKQFREVRGRKFGH